MTTEKHDPWALLREARESVFRDSLCREYDDSHKAAAMEEHRRRTRLLDRIDAALAERQGSATNVVEWEERQGSYIHDDGVNELRVYLWGDQWHWHAVVEYRANGICATEAEAKSAAIAAARGMR
jgi:hypothetical protein